MRKWRTLNGAVSIAACGGQVGMSLIEVLVTLVSTSVGLLGIAALQLVSLKSNQEVYVRLRATTLAATMLDCIRVNRAGFDNGEYDEVAFNAGGAAFARPGSDISHWQSEIDAALPGGAGVAAGAIKRVPGTNVVVVTVRWSTRPQAASPEEARASTINLRTEI
jgi:type IV pilus assembly protein PilV